MEEGKRWITWKGKHIPIRNGKIVKQDIAVHYGDLGKGRDTNYFSMNSNRRSTGHFGTGTYFM